ncbi:MAG: nitroreductase family protein [Patescibacteria group bacterium]|jgi:nitroreductase
MELAEAIKTRRSIRHFSNKELAEGVLEKIIEAGNHAPSHCNTQGWKFVFVNDDKIKEEMYSAGGSYAIKNAPYGILVLYNSALSDNLEYQDWIQSGAAAIQNMLLTIHDLGLGGCWIGHLPSKKKLRKIFNISKSYTPIAYIIFGYPEVNPKEMLRKHKVDDILSVNKFIWPGEKVSAKIYLKRWSKKIYFVLPSFVKKAIMPLTDKLVKKFHN